MDSIHGGEASELFEAQTHLYKHLYNLVGSMSLKCAVELGIPDIIHNHGKPITLPELASALQLHPAKSSCLQRFLRLLVHQGIFARTTANNDDAEREAYYLTPPSKLLLQGKEPCLSPVVLGSFLPFVINMWHSSASWFHENNEVSQFESASGMGFWEFISQHTESMNSLTELMVADSQMVKLALKDCKRVFESLNTIIDVGGGTGTVAKIICEAFPNLKCIVFDQPLVVANLKESTNLSYVGGDMFQSIPSADAVLLKWILHDWSDELCIKSLKNCKEPISDKGEEGRAIIIDIVIDEKSDNHKLTELKLFYDIMMMTLMNGKERTKAEWEKLFLEAGFRSYKITPIIGFKSLIEVYPYLKTAAT